MNVYDVPFVKPDTAQDNAPEVEHVFPPGDDVTVYPVIGEPPFDTGTDHDTVACALPSTADTPVGAPGTDTGPAMRRKTLLSEPNQMDPSIPADIDVAPPMALYGCTTIAPLMDI